MNKKTVRKRTLVCHIADSLEELAAYLRDAEEDRHFKDIMDGLDEARLDLARIRLHSLRRVR